MKNNSTEHAAQASLITWMRLAHPGILFFAVPNGAKLGGTPAQRYGQVAKLKAEGLTPGAPDVIILAPRGRWHGCLVEMKRTTGGRVSPEQAHFHALAQAAGYWVIIGRGADDAIEQVGEYLG